VVVPVSRPRPLRAAIRSGTANFFEGASAALNCASGASRRLNACGPLSSTPAFRLGRVRRCQTVARSKSAGEQAQGESGSGEHRDAQGDPLPMLLAKLEARLKYRNEFVHGLFLGLRV